MTNKIVVAGLGLVLTLSLCSAQNPNKSSNVAIKTLERELEAALLKGDSSTLDRILADDYIEIDAQGGLRKKADLIAVARARRARAGAVDGVGEHAVVLALDLVEAIADRIEEILVGIENGSVERELDHRLHAVDRGDHAGVRAMGTKEIHRKAPVG